MTSRILVLFAFWLTAGCDAGKPIKLGSCWNNLAIKSGSQIEARALALYNADGPLGINDLCKRNSMKAEFSNSRLEREALSAMRTGIGGKLYGSAIYDVHISGTITPSDDKINLYNINIDRFEILNATSDKAF